MAAKTEGREPDEIVKLRLPRDQYEGLRAVAAEDGNRTIASVIRAAISDYLGRQTDAR